eukprot:SAG11_NODE_5430_length_1563_cov_1.012295_3_plen_184_part_00
MLQILMSMPMAIFFYRTVFQIEFMTNLHVLAIYLVLGIGADDLFVFYDVRTAAAMPSRHFAPVVIACGSNRVCCIIFFQAWLQAAADHAPAPPGASKQMIDIYRLDHAYKRAGGAMLTTSFTTAIAFMATATSPVMPISAFGCAQRFRFSKQRVFWAVVLQLLHRSFILVSVWPGSTRHALSS